MILRPRILVIDDIVGSDVDPRSPEYRRLYCERLGLLDYSRPVARPAAKQGVVAEAFFCSGQNPEQKNSLDAVQSAFQGGWPSDDGRYWSAVLVDMKFGSDERFGLRVIQKVHELAPDVPIIVVSSLNQMETQVGETLRRAAERVGAQDFLAAPGASADADPTYHSTPENLKRRLDEIGLIPDPDQIVVGTSLALCKALRSLRQTIPSDAVGQAILLGESGSGKSHLAHYVHRQLAQRTGRSVSQVVFRSVVLSQKSEDMQKVQLFGTEGSTGRRQGAGVFEEASNRGLVFLDELGNLSATAQGDLLGVLQVQRDSEGRPYRSFTRDSPQQRESRCFVLAATNREWSELQDTLSEALLMRLEPVRVSVPALADRKEDLPLLVDSFVRASCARHGASIPDIEVPSGYWEQYASNHSVRQLHDLIDSAVRRNPFKSLLVVDDFQRSVNGESSEPQRQGPVRPVSVTEPGAAQGPDDEGARTIKGLAASIEHWMPDASVDIQDFDGAFLEIDKTVAHAKLRIWRELARRQIALHGSLNLLATVKRLLGKPDIPKSKPGDVANQIFNDAGISTQPADSILAEIWTRRRGARRNGGDE